MSLIEWRPEFSVGNLAVDHEHRELIDLINSLHEGIRQGAGREQVAAGLGEIYAQIAATTVHIKRITNRCSTSLPTSFTASRSAANSLKTSCRRG
jgi:hypothetical protein